MTNFIKFQALGLTGLGALQNQLLQQGLTANDLATVLSQAQAANVNPNNMGLSTADLSSNVLGNSSLTGNVLGPNSTLSSGPLSGNILIVLFLSLQCWLPNWSVMKYFVFKIRL